MMNKILLYNSGGGLGDSIQLFSFIISLKAHFKKAKIYYIGAHENHFIGKLKEYNIDFDAHPIPQKSLLITIASNLILPLIF